MEARDATSSGRKPKRRRLEKDVNQNTSVAAATVTDTVAAVSRGNDTERTQCNNELSVGGTTILVMHAH